MSSDARRDVPPDALVGAIPVKVRLENHPPLVEWLPIDPASIASGEFLDEAAERYRAANAHVVPFRTSWEALVEVARARGCPRPRGAIFHISRCGSTAVSNMLAALPRHHVIAEPSTISAVLHAPAHGHPPELQARWLHDLVGALGPGSVHREKAYFLKFTSWNVLHVAFVRQVFPELRWVFVYRDPVEVMVSILRGTTSWMDVRVKNPLLAAHRFGFDVREMIEMTREEYCARALARFFDVVLENVGENAGREVYLLNHRELFGAYLPDLLAFFDIDVTDDDMSRMQAAGRFTAKEPGSSTVFRDDSTDKRRAASASIHEMARRFVMDRYERIEALRASQAAAFAGAGAGESSRASSLG